MMGYRPPRASLPRELAGVKLEWDFKSRCLNRDWPSALFGGLMVGASLSLFLGVAGVPVWACVVLVLVGTGVTGALILFPPGKIEERAWSLTAKLEGSRGVAKVMLFAHDLRYEASWRWRVGDEAETIQHYNEFPTEAFEELAYSVDLESLAVPLVVNELDEVFTRSWERARERATRPF